MRHRERPAVDAALDAAFGPVPDGDDRQRRAARSALEGSLTVLVGGPGTGKTRTIARMLAAALILDGDSGTGVPAGPRAHVRR